MIRSTQLRLGKLEGVERVRFVPRQEALEALRRPPALAEVPAALPKNPLPDPSTVRAGGLDPSGLERLRAEITVDLKKLKVYSAHLSVITEGRVSLDITENIDHPMIKTFFVSYFRRDYPNLRLVEKAL